MLLPDPRLGLVLRLSGLRENSFGFLIFCPASLHVSPKTCLITAVLGIGIGDVGCKVVFIRPRSCIVAAASCYAGVPEPGLMGRRRDNSLPWA